MKILKVDEYSLRFALEDKLGIVTEVNNEFGRIKVDVFTHKSRTEYVFRASQGHLKDEKIAIVSLVMY